MNPKTDQEITEWMAGLPDKDIEMFLYLRDVASLAQRTLFRELMEKEKGKRNIR